MPFNVVVIGGGPIGLLSAIEARTYFTHVVVVEKRSTYTRMNAPVLSHEIREHFKKLGTQEQAGLGKKAQGIAPFHQIETALAGRALRSGVTILRPFVVTGVSGWGILHGGRYKEAKLVIGEWDEKTKNLLFDGQRQVLSANLIIVASGGGAARDPMLATLGFQWERLKARDYGAYAIFGQAQEASVAVGYQDRLKGQLQVRKIARKHLALDLPTDQYLLATLSGISPKDFKALQSSPDKRKEVMETIQRAAVTTVREIKQGAKNIGVFEIAIQQARQVYSPTYPAILLGDAAVTPHPEKGTGLATGFLGIEALRDLLKALKETSRWSWNFWQPSKEPAGDIVIYQTFNSRYKEHILRKALEGTATVLDSNAQLLMDYVNHMEGHMKAYVSNRIIDLIYRDLSKAVDLISDLKAQAALARKYLDYLDTRGEVESDLSWDDFVVQALWAWIANTQKDYKDYVSEIALLQGNLQRAQKSLSEKAQ